MRISEVELGNKPLTAFSQNEDFDGWTCTTNKSPASTTTSNTLGSSWLQEIPGQPRANWRGTIKNDLEKMGLAWEEAQSAALNRQEWHQCAVQCIHLYVCGMNRGQGQGIDSVGYVTGRASGL